MAALRSMIEHSITIADTIIWIAQERMKKEPFQNINAAICAVKLEVSQELMKFMSEHKGRR